MLQKLVIGMSVIAIALMGSQQTANAGKPDGPAVQFTGIVMRLESNATDGDAEVVIAIDAGEKLKSLEVMSPSGKKILNLKSRDGQRLGAIERMRDWDDFEQRIAKILSRSDEAPASGSVIH